jgi:branched-chain amino acid transport system permease protein
MNSKEQLKTIPANIPFRGLIRHRWVWLVIAFCLFAAMPVFVGTGWVSLLSEVLILAVAASALNLLVGYTGMISFGPAGLYAVGAYTTALLIVKIHLPFGFAMVAGPVFAAVASLIVGWFCVRRTAVYFALLTLAFSQLIHTVVFKWYSLTGGDDGILDIPIPTFLSSIDSYYYFTLACTAVCLLAMWMIANSAFGTALRVIRENPGRAEFIGINVRRYQLMAFVIQGFFLGAAGSLLCGFTHNVFPPIANWTKSIDIIIACLLGGMYHFLGPLVGSAVCILLDKAVTSFTEYWSLVLGIILILLVLFFRGGIAGFISEKLLSGRRGGD